jgi:hypothetical protein
MLTVACFGLLMLAMAAALPEGKRLGAPELEH